MEQFTALIVYLALFFIVPYVTTIVYLRWQRIHIRFAKQASVGMEMACFLPMIVATHVMAVLIATFLDRGITSVGHNLHAETWSGMFFGRSYFDTLLFLLSKKAPSEISDLIPWLSIFIFGFAIHFWATRFLAREIKLELNWASELQSQKANPTSTPLTPIREPTKDRSEQSEPEKPFFGLNALEWLRSFGIWNELSQDLSYRDSIGAEEIKLDVCLDGGGEVIYQGTLEAYSDSGGFNGIVMKDVQVKRNTRVTSDGQNEDDPKPRHFEMLLQHPHDPEHADKKKLDRLFISMGDIKTLHRRLKHLEEEDENQELAFKDQGDKALRKEDPDLDLLTNGLDGAFGYTKDGFKLGDD